MHRTLHHPNGFADLEITVEDGVLEAIANFANGDARMALNTLEMAVLNGQRNGHQVKLTNADLTQLTSTRSLRYDRAGDEHYDLISALHKSIRNSDVDAAVYWCSRMLAGGEEPLYIARRLVRFAAEDVGLADTNALQVATNTFQACAIDLEKRRPVFDNIFAGLSGPAVRPIALRMVWQAVGAVNIPVVGLGGIATGKDALEFIMAGATAVQVGAANFANPRAMETIAEEMAAWMDAHGVKTLDEIRGCAR